MNKLFIQGRMTGDPEVRKTQNDKDVGNFNMAVESGYGDYKKTTFFTVKVFGKQTNVLKHFSKGDGVIVSGSISEEKWEDKNTGEKRSKWIVEADDINFPLQKPKEKDTSGFQQAKEAAKPKDEFEDEIPF